MTQLSRYRSAISVLIIITLYFVLTRGDSHNEDKFECSHGICDLQCLANASRGCFMECFTDRSCSIACSNRSYCYEFCYNGKCNALSCQNTRNCIQLCRSERCEALICTSTKECQQRLVPPTDEDRSKATNEIAKAMCTSTVGQCRQYCSSRKCGLSCQAQRCSINAYTATVDIEIGSQTKLLDVSCSSTSHCIVKLISPDTKVNDLSEPGAQVSITIVKKSNDITTMTSVPVLGLKTPEYNYDNKNNSTTKSSMDNMTRASLSSAKSQFSNQYLTFSICIFSYNYWKFIL